MDAETKNRKKLERTGLTLKDWSDEDKPREKLIVKGKKELSNAELLAILLGSGSVGQSAVELAKEILRNHDNYLSLLSRRSVSDLVRDYKGVGEAKAVTIVAALELGYRLLSEESRRKEYYVTDSREIFEYIAPSLIDLQHEEFWAIYLNVKRKVLFKQRISSGGITSTPVDVRLIYATALEKSAVTIAVVHNHPTGIIMPSKDDKELTQKLLDAGKLLSIPLMDHLIVGINDKHKPAYFSFHDQGLI